MTSENKLKNLAAQLGVTVEVEKDNYNRSVEIQIAAPDGKQWVDGGSVHLVAVYYTYDKGGKNEAYTELLKRMQDDMEALDQELNP